MKVMIVLIVFVAPLLATAASNLTSAVDYWWCSECGLAYPASQKKCLNKCCPKFKQKK